MINLIKLCCAHIVSSLALKMKFFACVSRSPSIFRKSRNTLKLEETAKGVRISVHVYTNGRDTAINEAIATYLETKQRCEKEKIQIALMEISK